MRIWRGVEPATAAGPSLSCGLAGCECGATTPSAIPSGRLRVEGRRRIGHAGGLELLHETSPLLRRHDVEHHAEAAPHLRPGHLAGDDERPIGELQLQEHALAE